MESRICKFREAGNSNQLSHSDSIELTPTLTYQLQASYNLEAWTNLGETVAGIATLIYRKWDLTGVDVNAAFHAF
jgi:hypothetical protein